MMERTTPQQPKQAGRQIKEDAVSQPVSSSDRLASGLAIVCGVALVRVAIYLVAAPNYGYFRDEMYYLACGEHPAWGYCWPAS